MSEIEQVREKIKGEVFLHYWDEFCGYGAYYIPDERIESVIDQILSLSGVVVLAEDQHTPENPYDVGPYNYYLHGKSNSYYQAQQDMLEAGWVKKAEGGD